MTFTNKAANEMRERISSLLEDVSLESAPNVSTFHSFCVRLLRRDGDPLARIRPGFTRRFSIYDDEDQLQIIKAAYRALGLDEKEFLQYRAALSRISHAKNTRQRTHIFLPELLNAFVEQALTEAEKQQVTLHLASCADCREVVFLASSALAEELELALVAPAPPRNLRPAVAAAQRAEQPQGCARPVLQPRPKQPKHWWKWALPLTAILVLGATAC